MCVEIRSPLQLAQSVGSDPEIRSLKRLIKTANDASNKVAASG